MPYIKLENNINNEKLNKLLSYGTTFVGAFSKSCHHCINMQPEWKKFVHSVKKQKIRANILEIDANILSSIKNPLINNNIQGFPSLFIIKNNKFVASYANERTASNFLKFLNKYNSRMSKKSTLKRGKDRGSLTKKYRKMY